MSVLESVYMYIYIRLTSCLERVGHVRFEGSIKSWEGPVKGREAEREWGGGKESSSALLESDTSCVGKHLHHFQQWSKPYRIDMEIRVEEGEDEKAVTYTEDYMIKLL